MGSIKENDFRLLAEMKFPSQPGNERLAMEQVAALVQGYGFSKDRLERLKTAVAEAVMNAMEHGNNYQADLPAEIQVLRSNEALMVRIRDQGGGKPIPEHIVPDLEAKLAGRQSPRGWGLFLIEKMVDQMHVYSDEKTHTIELVMYLKEQS
jgi:anti-sigma regulatory factor (Ser/Thr protein kinase)